LFRCVAASILTFCPNGLLAPATAFNPEGLTFFMTIKLYQEDNYDVSLEFDTPGGGMITINFEDERNEVSEQFTLSMFDFERITDFVKKQYNQID
jgi:hypothetical protein